jgi:hypothetical protein
MTKPDNRQDFCGLNFLYAKMEFSNQNNDLMHYSFKFYQCTYIPGGEMPPEPLFRVQSKNGLPELERTLADSLGHTNWPPPASAEDSSKLRGSALAILNFYANHWNN